jgi:hypothetical protein
MVWVPTVPVYPSGSPGKLKFSTTAKLRAAASMIAWSVLLSAFEPMVLSCCSVARTERWRWESEGHRHRRDLLRHLGDQVVDGVERALLLEALGGGILDAHHRDGGGARRRARNEWSEHEACGTRNGRRMWTWLNGDAPHIARGRF